MTTNQASRINDNSTTAELIDWVAGWDTGSAITADDDSEKMAHELLRLEVNERRHEPPALDLAIRAVEAYQAYQACQANH